MNVRDLIEALEALDDKTLTVALEGCDCTNDAAGVTVTPGAPATAWSGPVPSRVLIEADL